VGSKMRAVKRQAARAPPRVICPFQKHSQ
jgi:hypothetical protein